MVLTQKLSKFMLVALLGMGSVAMAMDGGGTPPQQQQRQENSDQNKKNPSSKFSCRLSPQAKLKIGTVAIIGGVAVTAVSTAAIATILILEKIEKKRREKKASEAANQAFALFAGNNSDQDLTAEDDAEAAQV